MLGDISILIQAVTTDYCLESLLPAERYAEVTRGGELYKEAINACGHGRKAPNPGEERRGGESRAEPPSRLEPPTRPLRPPPPRHAQLPFKPGGRRGGRADLLAALALLPAPLELLEGDLPLQVIDQLRAEARHGGGAGRGSELQAGRGCRRCGARPAPSLRARVPRRRPQIPASAPQKADRGRPAPLSLQEGASAVAKGELEPPPSTPGVPRQGLPHISSPRAAPGYPPCTQTRGSREKPPFALPFYSRFNTRL